MALKRATAIPTIDVALIVLRTKEATPVEIALDTSTNLGVNPVIETVDAVKLVIKGILRAQKNAMNTITGHTLVLTDNVFSPELVKILQGGTITFDATETTKVVGYTPPVIGSAPNQGKLFDLEVYSAQYTPAGTIKNYEKVVYPNCQGQPIALTAQDGVFRVSEYTINSAPDNGVAPYEITYVDTLPVIS
ncbi:hypothetical protein D3C73_1260920 [compost metagenome]